MTSASRFRGKTAIVTGAASGIGRAMLARLVSEGAIALGFDNDAAGLAESVRDANDGANHGGSASAEVGSVADEPAVKSAVAAFVAAQGRLDVLVNLAGILRSNHFTETSLEQFRAV